MNQEEVTGGPCRLFLGVRKARLMDTHSVFLRARVRCFRGTQNELPRVSEKCLRVAATRNLCDPSKTFPGDGSKGLSSSSRYRSSEGS